MRYTSINCVYCGNAFEEKDDVVVCPICGSPHHRECWMKENRCANTDKHKEGFVWQFPIKETEKTEEKPKTVEGFVFRNGEGVVVCKECNTPNYENDAFCRKCHAPLTQNTANTNFNNQIPPINENPFEENHTENQFNQNTQNAEFMQENFNRFGGLNPEAMIDGIPVIEYSDYVGGNKPGKIIRRISLMERYGKNIAIFWPPLLFSNIWFFYRKMKKEGFIVSLALLVCSVLCAFCTINAPFVEFSKQTFEIMEEYAGGEITYDKALEQITQAETLYYSTALTTEETVKNYIAMFLNYACTIGIPIVCSVLALKLYRKKIKQDIFTIRQQCSDMQSYQRKLISKGGISIPLTALGVMILLLCTMIRTYLPVFIAVYFI